MFSTQVEKCVLGIKGFTVTIHFQENENPCEIVVYNFVIIIRPEKKFRIRPFNGRTQERKRSIRSVFFHDDGLVFVVIFETNGPERRPTVSMLAFSNALHFNMYIRYENGKFFSIFHHFYCTFSSVIGCSLFYCPSPLGIHYNIPALRLDADHKVHRIC